MGDHIKATLITIAIMAVVIASIIVTLLTISENKYINEPRDVKVCSEIQSLEAAKFIKESILNANNYSDEEMEDVIARLDYTGVKLYCDSKRLKIGEIDSLLKTNTIKRIEY